ncbi:transcriptional regulator ThrR, partial [Bacillus velezensis]
HLEDRSGALSQLLQAVADSGSNVLSIHQTIPLQGRANVTLSISTSAMEENIHTLMNKLRKFDFIEKVEILGSGA